MGVRCALVLDRWDWTRRMWRFSHGVLRINRRARIDPWSADPKERRIDRKFVERGGVLRERLGPLPVVSDVFEARCLVARYSSANAPNVIAAG